MLGSRGLLARGVLRRAGAAAAPRHRQRRQLLAHARSADAAADQRRAARADRARASSRPTSRGRGGRADRPQRVHESTTSTRSPSSPRGGSRSASSTRRPAASPERSARYRDLLEPAGIPHELRAAFVMPRAGLGRRPHRPRASRAAPSPQRDADALAAARRRRSPRASAPRCASTPPAASPAPKRRGSSSSAPRDEVELITPPARDCSPRSAPRAVEPERGELPSAVLALAVVRPRRRPTAAERRQRRHRARPRRLGHPARLAARTRPAAASRSSSSAPRGPRAATVRLEALGATAREREVATLLARGLTQPGDRRDARPLPAHRRGPRQEPLREARRRLAPGARRPRLPRRVPPRGDPRDAAHLARALRGRLSAGYAEFARASRGSGAL